MERIDRDKVQRILLVSLSNLGDIILTTPVLQKLCEEFPAAGIDVVSGPGGRAIFKGHDAVREIIVFHGHRSLTGRLKQLVFLRRKRYDLVVDLKGTFFPLFSGARYRSRFLLFPPGRHYRKNGRMHKKDEHLLKLRGLGIDTGGAGFFAPITPEDRESAGKVLAVAGDKKKVIINPGARSHLKRWDVRRYAALSDRLTAELGCSVLVSGNEDDRDVIQQFLLSVSRPVADLCGRTSVGALMELMRRVDLVITNDSAPLHMASAVNAPTVAIFGPSDELKYGPLSEKNRVLTPRVICRPCGRALCATGPDEGCIGRVEVEEVFRAAKEMLES